MTEYEKMLAGELYYVDDEFIQQEHKKAVRLFEKYNKTSQKRCKKREKLIKALFCKTGRKFNIEPPFFCDFGTNVEIGENFFANYGCIILDGAKVKIGDNCLLGPNVGIYSASHPTDQTTRIKNLGLAYPVTIGNNCWLGGGVVVCPGVTLGNNVVVGAGSVVTKNFGDNVVIAGNPAKVIRNL